MVGISADKCAQTFSLGWVAYPDRGCQFMSNIWNHLATSLGCRTKCTTSDHPQSNELVERFHRSLKSSLHARLSGSHWLDELPWVLLSLCMTPKPDLGYSLAGCTLRHQPLLPRSIVTLSHSPDPSIPPLPHHHCTPTTSQLFPTLEEASHVFVKISTHQPPLDPPLLRTLSCPRQ